MVFCLVAMAPGPVEGGPNYRPPGGDARYARVTLTNPSDVTVTFRMKWPGRPAERMTLRPGEQFTAETTFPAGTIQPDLRVRFEAGDWDRRREALELPSGHVAPYTNNPGRVYDFWRVRTPFGSVIDLRPR
jgi:hypothetical protein